MRWGQRRRVCSFWEKWRNEAVKMKEVAVVQNEVLQVVNRLLLVETYGTWVHITREHRTLQIRVSRLTNQAVTKQMHAAWHAWCNAAKFTKTEAELIQWQQQSCNWSLISTCFKRWLQLRTAHQSAQIQFESASNQIAKVTMKRAWQLWKSNFNGNRLGEAALRRGFMQLLRRGSELASYFNLWIGICSAKQASQGVLQVSIRSLLSKSLHRLMSCAREHAKLNRANAALARTVKIKQCLVWRKWQQLVLSQHTFKRRMRSGVSHMALRSLSRRFASWRRIAYACQQRHAAWHKWSAAAASRKQSEGATRRGVDWLLYVSLSTSFSCWFAFAQMFRSRSEGIQMYQLYRSSFTDDQSQSEEGIFMTGTDSPASEVRVA